MGRVGERHGDLLQKIFALRTHMEELLHAPDLVSDGGPPRSKDTLNATGEEQGLSTSSRGFYYDATGLKSSGSPAADVPQHERKGLRCTSVHTLATWNVRGMSLGKLEIVKREMKRLHIDLIGISELHWTGSGYFESDDFTVFYSGHDEIRRNGVAFITNKKTSSAVESYRAINDRIMIIRVCGKPMNISVVQVYAPTTDADEGTVDGFFAEVQRTLNEIPKRDIVYIMGDFNSKIGGQVEADVVGRFGLGERNEAGDRLVQFCLENRLRITNTFFMQPKRRLYTWTSPNGLFRNQIDFILCAHRWRSSVMAAKTFPGADCGSDHELLAAKIRVRFCGMKKGATVRKFDTSKIPLAYAVEVTNRFGQLSAAEMTPEELWGEIKSTILEAAHRHITFTKPKRRRCWLSEQTIRIADHRRIAKVAGNKDEMRRLNADFQRAARRDKEADWNGRCRQLEEDFLKGHTRGLFSQIRMTRQPFAARKGNIKDRNGKELIDHHSIKDRWKEYAEELYACRHGPEPRHDVGVLDLEPPVLEAEVARAMKQLAKNKAPGIDNIPAELLQTIPVKVITGLCQAVWDSMEWPRDWKRSVFIPLPKKGDSRGCSNYRTIALIPHASKILLKIIQERLRPVIDAALPDVQAGFRRGRGTRDHIANLRWIMERAREYQKNIYMCFIDYSKAFDCVEHDKLWQVLQELGVSLHLIRLMQSLYTKQEATVRTAYGDTEWFQVGRGVRQGCILSPFLFNLYAEVIMRRLELEDWGTGVKIGGRNINNLRYADDTTLFAETESELRQLIVKIKAESEKMGLYLNVKKTKIMTTAGIEQAQISIGKEVIECVRDFIFLGSRIDFSGEVTPEIKRRINLGRSAMLSLERVWKSRDIGIDTKQRLVQAIVFPIAMYGCESWALKKADRRRIDVFELWCWRRLLRIPWTARVTNAEVLERMRPDTSLEGRMTRLRLSYFGHVMRSNSLEKAVMLGLVDGKRRPGCQRTRWIDTIKADSGLNIVQLKEAVLDRRAWKELTYRVAKGRIRLNG